MVVERAVHLVIAEQRHQTIQHSEFLDLVAVAVRTMALLERMVDVVEVALFSLKLAEQAFRATMEGLEISTMEAVAVDRVRLVQTEMQVLTKLVEQEVLEHFYQQADGYLPKAR
jgi:hypothetical protein